MGFGSTTSNPLTSQTRDEMFVNTRTTVIYQAMSTFNEVTDSFVCTCKVYSAFEEKDEGKDSLDGRVFPFKDRVSSYTSILFPKFRV